jgi:hypothetical protein
VTAPGALWRPLGFLLLMIGFGLRLDTEWQGVAAAFTALGAGAGILGLIALVRRPVPRAFVARGDGR